MRLLFIVMILAVASCGQPLKEKESITHEPHERPANEISALPVVGQKIGGDFNGDGQPDLAIATRIREGKGNPVEDGTPDEYAIQFPDNNLGAIPTGCCEVILVNEGDLNNDGADDISIFKAPMNGCSYSMETYSFHSGAWTQIVETFLIPTGCETVTEKELQARIFKEKGTIYYLDTDPNDENGMLVKMKASLKNHTHDD